MAVCRTKKTALIYLLTEVAGRELSANIRLATEASLRGFEAIIIEEELFRSLFYRSGMPVGIVHLKSLRPQPWRIAFYKDLKRRGFTLTSQDQESGLLQEKFKWFASARYSDESLSLVDGVMTWGARETKFLRETYPQHTAKLHETGSPRVDLWREKSSSPPNPVGQEFILFSSNLPILASGGFWSPAIRKQAFDVSDRMPSLERNLRTIAFIYNLAKLMKKQAPDLLLVVRPHIAEAEEAWPALLGSFTNVHITREGSISDYLPHSLCLIHQGCTTGIEAFISKKKSFAIGGLGEATNIADRLSIPTNTPSSLLEDLLSNKSQSSYRPASAEAELRQRLKIPNSASSSSQIADFWLQLAIKETGAKRRLRFNRLRWRLFLVALKVPPHIAKHIGIATGGSRKFPEMTGEQFLTSALNLPRGRGGNNVWNRLSGKCFYLSPVSREQHRSG